jgi:hypothetical protein
VTSFLDTRDLDDISVVDDSDGTYELKLKFNASGKTWLAAHTTANLGKHIAVYCTIGGGRWLGAPKIYRPLNDGVLTFTPDASREECDHIVTGIKNAIVKAKKDEWK